MAGVGIGIWDGDGGNQIGVGLGTQVWEMGRNGHRILSVFTVKPYILLSELCI